MLHFFVYKGESVTLKLIEVLKGKFQEDFFSQNPIFYVTKQKLDYGCTRKSLRYNKNLQLINDTYPFTEDVSKPLYYVQYSKVA